MALKMPYVFVIIINPPVLIYIVYQRHRHICHSGTYLRHQIFKYLKKNKKTNMNIRNDRRLLVNSKRSVK